MRTSRVLVLGLVLLALTGIAPFVLGDVLRLGSLATGAIPAAAAFNQGGLIWDSTLKKMFISSSTAWNEVDDGPVTLNAVPATGLLALATLSGEVLPARAFTMQAMRFRVSVAGNTGSTNAVLRASDGTNNCDASFACNATAGNFRVATTGTCAFPASASMTYTVNAIGDCVTPATILGSLVLEGEWR